ncbi:hypothetical protein SO694_00008173 [Aureococcus anophagefferens]|uniref:Uncharacterized protein n=1 Tax=Aureococcus anophagefferens TaxID=44056 RepID=A0ABR1GE12_AURAN
MAAFGAARCQATVGRELEDDDEAVTVVPGDAEEAPAPTTLVLLMASHIASADRLCALGDALRAASAAQTAAPDGILLSWSAEEAWRESARRLVKECDCGAVECAGRRSQFEHLAALGALVAHRWGKKRSVWCFFGDDDDLARPSRTAGVPAVTADARRCASVCAMWRAEAARAAADAPPRPRSAADVEALLAALAPRSASGSTRERNSQLQRLIARPISTRASASPYERFHYAVRVPALLSFLGAAPPALKAARFCDVAFVEFLRRTDRVVFALSGAFKACWLYFYGGCDGPRASRSVPVDAAARTFAAAHVAASGA